MRKSSSARRPNNSKDKVEEVYSFGKFGERGAARFQTEEGMWEFMTANRGKLKFEAEGKEVYASLDAIHDANPAKTKAVRKVVRLIIEKEKLRAGIDGNETKKNMYINYFKGKVLWEEERVAEWDEDTGLMKLKGKLEPWWADYNKLMAGQ